MKQDKISTDAGRRRFLKKVFGTAFAGSIITRSALASDKSTGEGNNLPASASGEAFLGDILMVAFGYAPRNWLKCEGQLLQIRTNQALFSLLGTTYGGNGTQNFALPDFRGRSPMHPGERFRQGNTGGEVNHILSLNELPRHTHSTGCTNNYGTSESPVGLAPAKNSSAVPQYSATTGSSMGASSSFGSGLSHNNMPPYTVLNFIICTAGVFPSRD